MTLTQEDRTAQTTQAEVEAALVARAAEIAPTLVDRQAETEERTFYAEDTHQAFHEAGFYKMFVPKKYGGLEVGMETYLNVIRNLAQGCPSTAWCLALGHQHTLVVASQLNEQAQSEVFEGGEFISPGTTPPFGTIERAGDDEWIVNGTWPFCSGSPYASYDVGHARSTEFDVAVMFVAPRSQWERLDDWGGQLGMRGTGSHSIKIENGRIPDRYVVPGGTIYSGGPNTGLALHGNPIYGAPLASGMVLVFAAIGVGTMLGALDEYRRVANTKVTYRPPKIQRSEAPEFQQWYAKANALVATANAALQALGREWTEHVNAGTLDQFNDMRFVTMVMEINELNWQALDILFKTVGSTSLQSGERIERIWRDMSTLRTHTGLLFLNDTAQIEVGRLGLAE